MELSKQVIHFKATSLNDWSLQDVYLVNNHLSTNEYTHPVPRIGKLEASMAQNWVNKALMLQPGWIRPPSKIATKIGWVNPSPNETALLEFVRALSFIQS